MHLHPYQDYPKYYIYLYYIMTHSKFDSIPILMQLSTFCTYQVVEATELQLAPLVQ